jgi:HD-GYP domain-containing protein (c-di-GMP phosphodiesterase class II)
VLAVADAFDCMTSTRSYRGARTVAEAVGELRRCSGTQFDPAFVDALVAAVGREGWQTPEVPEPPPGEPIEAAAHDHDDPAEPLRVTGSR